MTSAVFIDCWRYWEATRDKPFLESVMAEVMLEIAMFWQSVSTYSDEDARFHIEGVVGPDTFHNTPSGYTAYPAMRTVPDTLCHTAPHHIVHATVCGMARVWYGAVQSRVPPPPPCPNAGQVLVQGAKVRKHGGGRVWTRPCCHAAHTTEHVLQTQASPTLQSMTLQSNRPPHTPERKSTYNYSTLPPILTLPAACTNLQTTLSIALEPQKWGV